MTRILSSNWLMATLITTLVIALALAAVIAALNARAGNHDDHTIIGANPELSQIFVEGNTFPDDFRAEYRLKFGDPDDAGPGRSGDAPPLQEGARETYERMVNDGSGVYMGTLTFDPEQNGEVGGVDWHTHPGPFVVAVVEGALTITWSSDCQPRTYEAGEAFVDLGETIHKAENLSGEQTVVFFSVIGVPEGEPITNVVAHDEGFEAPC